VTAEVLRQRLADDVGAAFERALEVRGRKRVVDRTESVVSVGDIGKCADVVDVQQGFVGVSTH